MPSIKGTASVADARARSKALKSTKFPANFTKKIKLDKVNKAVLTQWIEQKVTSILGFDDEIVSSTAINLFLPSDGSNPDPRRAQLDLVGFLGEEESANFAKDLWTLLVEAQDSPSGIPRTLLEAKKKELSQQNSLGQQGRMLQPHARGSDHLSAAGSRVEDPEMNRFVQEANRRAAAVRHLVPEVAEAGEAGPVPIPVSPPHPSEQHPTEDPNSSNRSNRERKGRSQEGDRKIPARRSHSGSRHDHHRPPRNLPPPPYDDGPLPPPGRGGYRRDIGDGGRWSRHSSRDRSRSAEYGGVAPPLAHRYGPNGEDEFRRTNDWRRDDAPLPPPLPPPPRHPDERRRRGGSAGRGPPPPPRRRYYSEEEEIDDLERRLSVLKKKRVGKRGDDYALDNEIDDIEDRLDELDRRRRRRRRAEEEEYRRRGARRDFRPRSRSRSRSNGPHRLPPGPPPPRRSPPPRDDRRRRGPSPEFDASDRRRRRSPSTDGSTSSSQSTSSSSVSSRSSEDSRDSHRRGRGGGRRGRSRSASSSRSYSEDSRR